MLGSENLQAPETAEKKAALRKELRAKRRALSPEEVAKASEAVAEKVIMLPEFSSAELILSYMPAKNELDVALINRAARAAGKRLAFPLCIENGGLRLLVPEDETAFTVGSYGIMEPDPDRSEEVTAEMLELMIVPAVAFTHSLRRLGQGGGYYDRLLEKTHAVTVGVGYDFQLLDELPLEPHDRSLDIAVTPSELIRAADNNE